MKTVLIKVSLCFALALGACTADELPAPLPPSPDCETLQVTFDLNVKEIVINTCAYSGCHPEYINFGELRKYLDDGSFRSRVVTLREDPVNGMPPDNAPADKPKDLTPEEVEIIECWLSKGYPEN